MDKIHTNSKAYKKDKRNHLIEAKNNESKPAVLACLFLCLLTAIISLKSKLVAQAIAEALLLCGRTVIPSLFPFMVLNSVWVQSGFAAWLGRCLNGLTGRLFGISGCGTPFLLGILGGFPLGAECICAMVRQQDCSREEAERMLAFCNNTGPSFLIFGIGSAMFGSTKTGCILYVSQLLSAILTGIVFCMIYGRMPLRSGKETEIFFSGNMLVSAISESVISLLKICGFITAFGGLTALAGNMAAGLPAAVRALLYGFLELTSGALQAASTGGLTGITVCGAICGWAGWSVHMQTMSAVRELNLGLGHYYRGKLLQCLFCAGITLILCKFFC